MADKKALEEREARKASQAKLEAALDAAKAELLSIAGVVDVGIGLRIKSGKTTDEFVFTVLVREKLPEEQLSATDRIPKTVQGFPTDVVKNEDEIRAIGFSDEEDSTNYSRKIGGSQISRKASSGIGTLGCFVRMADSKVALLTCHHVLWDDGETPSAGIGIGQPEFSDSICCVCNEMATTLVPPAGAQPSPGGIDCALGLIKEGTSFSPKIRTISRSNGTVEQDGTIAGSAAPVLNDIVWKVGRRTGLTRGKIILVTPRVTIEPVAPFAYVADHGDSGSVVVEVTTGNVVGLLKSIDKEIADGGTLGFATSIIDVLALLNVTVIPTSSGDATVSATADERLGDVASPRPEDVFAAIADRLRTTPRGDEILSIYRRFSREISLLVNTCRPVTVAWQRSAGPAWLAAVMRSAREPLYRFPEELNGVRRSQLSERLLAALAQHGSPELRNALAEYGPECQAAWDAHDTVDALIADLGAQNIMAVAAE